MKIAIVGYGKMGKAISELAVQRGHKITQIITKDNTEDLSLITPQLADVAIEFTNPESAFSNIVTLLKNKLPTISGSTGWTNSLEDAQSICINEETAFLWASNFSIGVNLFYEINNYVAQLMQSNADYIPSIEEIHHTQKKDAPSGTAITLANQILKVYDKFSGWQLSTNQNPDKLTINSIRQDPAPGTHTITYHSAIDDIKIMHIAHSRAGFALGALLAAEYIYNKKGVFQMKDVLFG